MLDLSLVNFGKTLKMERSWRIPIYCPARRTSSLIQWGEDEAPEDSSLRLRAEVQYGFLMLVCAAFFLRVEVRQWGPKPKLDAPKYHHSLLQYLKPSNNEISAYHALLTLPMLCDSVVRGMKHSP
jgi:hypothetical protein